MLVAVLLVSGCDGAHLCCSHPCRRRSCSTNQLGVVGWRAAVVIGVVLLGLLGAEMCLAPQEVDDGRHVMLLRLRLRLNLLVNLLGCTANHVAHRSMGYC